MAADNRHELADFVIRRTFEPVLKVRMGDRSEADRRTLAQVQEIARSEIERYRGYDTAEKVVAHFRRDLQSPATKKVHAALRHLHLPTLEDFSEEFERKAHRLGVDAAS